MILKFAQCFQRISPLKMSIDDEPRTMDDGHVCYNPISPDFGELTLMIVPRST